MNMWDSRVTRSAATLATAALLMGSQCPSIPSLQNRVVQLVVNHAIEVEFVSVGELNMHNDTATIDLNAEVDFLNVLDDAGIDVSDVSDISLSGVSYKRTQPDPRADREIVNGTCTLRRGSGPTVTLFAGVSEVVNTVTDWKTAPVSAAGVSLLNDMLDDILAAVQAGVTPADMVLTYTVSGQSLPSDVETNFKWAVKLDVSVVGEIEIDVPG